MASVHRRNGRDGKPLARWYYSYTDEHGRRRERAGTTDKRATLEIARKAEGEARQIREGVIEPGEPTRRRAALRPPADHLADYRLQLLARGDTEKHVRHTIGVLTRLLDDAGIDSVARIFADRITAALGRLRAARSPRTANHARAAVKSWVAWLVDNGRLRVAPEGLGKVRRYSEQVDRKRVRRALSPDELARLIAAAESGPAINAGFGPTKSKLHATLLAGPDRAWLYRLAVETGFRANELRSLTPESFDLGSDDPTVTVRAAYSKHRRDDRQPLRRAIVPALAAWLAGKPPGQPVVAVPARTAQMLRVDLARAGIPYRTAEGVADFHALRAAFITGLVRAGANPSDAQRLARHSDVRLTLTTYTKTTPEGLRGALEGE